MVTRRRTNSRFWMEKGRSFSSDDEFRERRKKMGSLPLAVFLSFNDRDVHPQCPNASNPYHKCGRHCLDKISSGNKLFDGESSGGSSTEWEKVSEKWGVKKLNCPNASNPYHKCADYCFDKLTVMKPKEKNIVHTEERVVNSKCKNASNPYHVCAEYCFQDVPEKSQPVQSMKLKSPKGRKKLVPNTDITGVNPHCRFASNPYHKCAEYCFQNVPDWDISDGVSKSKEIKNAARDAERRDRKPKFENASNLYHISNKYRFQGIPGENRNMKVLIKEKKEGPQKDRKGDNPVMENKSMDFELVEASDTSITSDSYKTITTHTESESVKEDPEVEANVVELSDTQPLRIDAFDLFHEWAKYCSLKATEDDAAKQDKTGQRG